MKVLIFALALIFVTATTACGGGGSGAGAPAQTQLDTDKDGIVNSADSDDDNDGVLDVEDAFPLDPSESQDSDGDGTGDNADAFPENPAEKADSDGDGVGDNADAFPNNAAETEDSDGDGVGNNSDSFPDDPLETVDSDGDGVGNNADAFPEDSSETNDTDLDGVGDNADVFPTDPEESADSDGDGVGDNHDAFPTDDTESVDTDGDGVGDNADQFPEDPAESQDSDADGVGDNSDVFPDDPLESVDADSDGIGDNADNCRVIANGDQLDTDFDDVGNVCDLDDDGDGIIDALDAFPLDNTEYADFDSDGVGDNADNDDDNDSLLDTSDPILMRANKIELQPEEMVAVEVHGYLSETVKALAPEGWHVQYEVYDAITDRLLLGYAEQFLYNAEFQEDGEYWSFEIPVPRKPGEYYIRVSLYCSVVGADCDLESALPFHSVQQRLNFSVLCADTDCTYIPDAPEGVYVTNSLDSDIVPKVIRHASGRLYALYSTFDNESGAVNISFSEDDGISWSNGVTVANNISINTDLASTDDGTLLVATMCANYSLCIYSSGNSVDWVSLDLLSDTNFHGCNINNCEKFDFEIASLLVTSTGEIVLAYFNGTGDSKTLYTSTSLDLSSWSSPVVVTTDELSIGNVNLVQLPSGGVYLFGNIQGDEQFKVYETTNYSVWTEFASVQIYNASEPALVTIGGDLRILYVDWNGGNQKPLKSITLDSDGNPSDPVTIFNDQKRRAEAVLLNNGNVGYIYSDVLNHQRDIFFHEVEQQ